ncbi:hypothetical protein ATL39_3124 [Sinobaca qinghaiensis]|uniref:Uncharacterized protein n=1 Tax=Sinobaca qinghaiensis TaxID=342944 RepID=A0A419UX34_9BACL|nr:hypothetical protein [Sinobaca qinghaiensis]RKD69697.1 hypothetical protein ATL39_3124 [Sinobaca qinghaiensis]
MRKVVSAPLLGAAMVGTCLNIWAGFTDRGEYIPITIAFTFAGVILLHWNAANISQR